MAFRHVLVVETPDDDKAQALMAFMAELLDHMQTGEREWSDRVDTNHDTSGWEPGSITSWEVEE